jgi:hypothetical protein
MAELIKTGNNNPQIIENKKNRVMETICLVEESFRVIAKIM